MGLDKKRVFLTFAVVLLGLVMFFSQPGDLDYSGAAVTSFFREFSCDDLDNTGKNEGMETSNIFIESKARSIIKNKKNNDLINDKIDDCKSYGKLKENYCVATYPYVQTKVVDCVYGCYSGACRLPPCNDPDLGKYEYTTKGTVTGLNKLDPKALGTPPTSQYPREYTDYCSSSDKLVEYYCSKDGGVESKEKSCACIKGRCV